MSCAAVMLLIVFYTQMFHQALLTFRKLLHFYAWVEYRLYINRDSSLKGQVRERGLVCLCVCVCVWLCGTLKCFVQLSEQ